MPRLPNFGSLGIYFCTARTKALKNFQISRKEIEDFRVYVRGQQVNYDRYE